MGMKILRDATTGEISKIFDPDEVALIEISDCGREVWATLKSGYRFMLFELMASRDADITATQFLESIAESYKKKKGS